MYPCPNCRAGLRFDIPKQQLVCDYCDSVFDPYTIVRDKDAVERETFETTVFTCPQCGGELISDDETAATFCSYCGGTTVLDSRIKDERRPAFIITFKKTKDQCKAAFVKAVKRNIFAPSEFRDPEQIDKFRGIYMPYWAYDFETRGDVNFSAKSSHRSGDYIIEENYRISGSVEGKAEGITYDATSTFSDDISSSIAPYNIKERQDFTPSMLSGFYADTNDVEKALYSDDASDMVARYNQTVVLDKSTKSSMTVEPDQKKKLLDQLTPSIKNASLAFLPVWFLSYRTKDERIAYAVVNGQTGKISVDLPVDKKKFLFIGFGIAAVLFLIFNFVFTFKPSNMLIATIIVSIILMFISGSQAKNIKKKEQYENDQGMLYRRTLEKMEAKERGEITADQLENATAAQKRDYIRSDSLSLRCAAAVNSGEALKAEKEKSKVKASTFFLTMVLSAALGFIVITLLKAAPDYLADIIDRTLLNFMEVVCIVIAAFVFYALWRNLYATGNPFKRRDRGSQAVSAGILKPMLSAIIALLVVIVDPVLDIYYYGAALFCVIMLVITEFEVIDRHNKLTTRKPPQLGRRGGDENA